MDIRFQRVKPLFNPWFETLQKQRVAVVGLGGVGGICAESLVRSGIMKLTIVDFDRVEPSNLNRQNVALTHTMGKLKTEVLTQRLKDINPDLDLIVHSVYLDETNVESLLENCVAVVDAIDSIPAKISLIDYALKQDKVLISSMGMGNRVDPTKIEITTINKTYNDPFSKQIRLKTKALGIKAFKVVFSSELPQKSSEVLASFMPVTASAGLLLASEIMKDMIRRIQSMHKEIVLAGGCFWGVQEFFRRAGTHSQTSGYSQGHVKHPSYEQVCTGETGHAEVVKIVYDPETISLKRILELYFRIIDPTLINQQGNDIGTQYRTGIYFVDPTDEAIIVEALKQEQLKYSKPLVVEVEPVKNFYEAEGYHQDYLIKNPQGYCHVDMSVLD